jgi:YVTN family beta-propeller protein
MIRTSFHAISTLVTAAALLALAGCDGGERPDGQTSAREGGEAPAAAIRAAGESVDLAESYIPKRGNPRPAGGAPVVGPWDGSGQAYVANQKAGTVSVVDLASGRVDTIPAGKDPHHPYVTLDQRWVLVTTHHDDDFILAIATNNGDRTHRIETGAGSAPLHLAQSPETGMIAVTLNGSGEVAILDPEGATLERKVSGIGKKPRDPGFTLGGRKLYLMPTSDTVIAVVDTESWSVRHIPRHPRGVHHDYSGVEHSGLDVSPDGRLVAATNPPAGEVVFIDAESEEIVGRVKGLPDPGNPSFLGTTGFLGTGNPEDGSVSIIDTRDGAFRHVATVKTGPGANIPQVGPDGRVYATANDGSSVAVLDPVRWEVVDRIEGLEGPHWIVFSPDGSRGYITNASGSTLTVVDMADLSVIETIPVGDGPNGVMLRTPDVS